MWIELCHLSNKHVKFKFELLTCLTNILDLDGRIFDLTCIQLGSYLNQLDPIAMPSIRAY